MDMGLAFFLCFNHRDHGIKARRIVSEGLKRDGLRLCSNFDFVSDERNNEKEKKLGVYNFIPVFLLNKTRKFQALW